MENTEVNCECNLVSINYRLEKYPSLYESNQRSQSRDSANSINKSKISLSKNKSRGGSLHSRGAVSQVCSYTKNSQYPSDISNKYCKFQADSKGAEHKKTTKKKFSQLSRNYQTVVDTKTKDLQQTKNTTFNNSIANSNHFTRQQRMADTISFFGQKKTDEGKLSKKSNARHAERQSLYTYEANIYSREQLKNTDQFDRLRRIKTLKQLQFKNAQSSGKMTSQNHMSLAVVSDQQNPNQLKGLNGLLNKNNKYPLYFSKTEKMVN